MYRLSCAVLALVFSVQAAFAQVGFNESVLNPNLAESDELEALPYLDKASAEAIIAARPIADNLQLAGILAKTLGEDQMSEVLVGLFLPVNLNSASNEEIMLIAGMGRRMAHEFEEYRPYGSIEQFQREIGKYVDQDEVARFEQYVFVPLSLNSASSDDLATIPGISGRMVHEFEEYRPYTSIEQFRREIGKYVDQDEVARLERYVRLD